MPEPAPLADGWPPGAPQQPLERAWERIDVISIRSLREEAFPKQNRRTASNRARPGLPRSGGTAGAETNWR